MILRTKFCLRYHPSYETDSDGRKSLVNGPSSKDANKVSMCWGCSDINHALRDCSVITDEAERSSTVEEKKLLFMINNCLQNPIRMNVFLVFALLVTTLVSQYY